MPVPADMRGASPGTIRPRFACEALCASSPSSTQVTLSVSRAGVGRAGRAAARVPLGGLALRLPLQYPGDDLHVAVGMGLEAGAGLDDVVIGDEQEAEVSVPRIVVVAEAEAMPRVEPARLRE